VIPPEANAEFVCCMEDVLDIYKRPYDPKHPVVCFDETNKQLVKENKTPLPPEPGQVERYDYEYERNGHWCSLIKGEKRYGVRLRGNEEIIKT
jgi:hypothetical protein